MTPEAQRIAIAEACGWRHVRGLGVGLPGPVGHHPERFVENEPRVEFMESVPDYLNDLNAMHSAVENHLDNDQKQEFAWELYRLIEPKQWIINAIAAQRAEAFLKCLNLWKD